jgi:hypothetical protein
METAPSTVSPLIEELVRFRDERRMLTFTLIGGEKIEGAVRWFDGEAIHIVTPSRDEVTLFRSSVLYYHSVR